MKVLNPGDKKIYIESVMLNGKPYSKSFIRYKDSMNGGELEFRVSDKPNKKFGFNLKDRPVSKVYF